MIVESNEMQVGTVPVGQTFQWATKLYIRVNPPTGHTPTFGTIWATVLQTGEVEEIVEGQPVTVVDFKAVVA